MKELIVLQKKILDWFSKKNNFTAEACDIVMDTKDQREYQSLKNIYPSLKNKSWIIMTNSIITNSIVLIIVI